ncbi:hypothetical protein ABTN55_20320, partial [Acinetobacter baumannii]
AVASLAAFVVALAIRQSVPLRKGAFRGVALSGCIGKALRRRSVAKLDYTNIRAGWRQMYSYERGIS